MSRKNVDKVVQRFMSGMSGYGPKNRGGDHTIWTDGVTIYSYRMPIAVKIGDRAMLVSQESPTVTTTIHRNDTRSILLNHGYNVAMVDAAVVKRAADMLSGDLGRADGRLSA